VTALAGIVSDILGALRDGVEILMDPTTLVQLPNGNDDVPADVDVSHYHDAVVSGLLGVSSPPSPEVALSRAEKIKFEKYSEGLICPPDIRSIPFAGTEFGALGGHATDFCTEMIR
jgi:hypothetical protein